LRYLRYFGLNWETQTLTKGWDTGVTEQPSIALDVNDHPHISFTYHMSIGDYGVDTIMYAHFNGENWLFDLIDYKNTGRSSIALGTGGLPHVSYRRSSGREGVQSTLLYAYHPGISLAVSTKGNGTGNVMSSPAGINCGPVCKYEFQPGTQLTLTALPEPGSGFAGWVGCPTPSGNTCSLLLTDRNKVTALFSKSTLKVKKKSVNKGTGTVVSSDGNISCGTDCSESYPTGTAVTLTAQPDAGSTFLAWSGACSGTSLECVLTLGKNTSVTAKFAK
jgi:hypothetical protein